MRPTTSRVTPGRVRAGRRPLIAAVALALAPPVVLLGPSASAPAGAASTANIAPVVASVRLLPVAGGVSQATVALSGRTTTLHTSGYSMAGVTWTGARAPGRVAVRWPDGHRGWVRWRTLPRQTDLPGASE